MEALWKTLRKGSLWTEVDHVYENIEAPKFVDFAAPDRSCPDGRSWFCARIGCDENHEEVDPDVVHKNFVLRVMAARSPNVRLQKALSRNQDPSAKCPRSAPAKNSRSGIGRLAETPSRLKNHQISVLASSTPIKASQNAKISKPKELLPKNKPVAKVLNTPTKSVKELRSIAEKLQNKIRETPADQNREELQEFDENKENAASNRSDSSSSPKTLALDFSAKFPQIGNQRVQIFSAFNCGTENRLANSCDVPRKKMMIFDKNKSKSAQGAKFRALKPTNPKPFRLRTDERGILREKNLERERKPTTPKPFRFRTDERGILREKNLEREKKAENKEKMQARILKERGTAAAPPLEERTGGAAGELAAPLPPEEKKKGSATKSKASSSAYKKALTVPRGPTFARVNVPKRCVKRVDLAS